MGSKYGLNTLCWCNSGKKYKKCHWQRELQVHPPPYATAKIIKRHFSTRHCLAPSTQKPLCRGSIVRAHTVSKSAGLKTISRSGHVYTWNKDLMSLHANGGHLLVQLIGINVASTFTGFCEYHDRYLFSEIENKPFTDTPEQCFLVGYRSVVRELFSTTAAKESLPAMRDLDKGRELSQQIAIQRYLKCYLTGKEIGLRNIQQHKRYMDSILVNRDFSSVHSYVIDLEQPPDIMCSGGLYIETDFEGNATDNLRRSSEILPDLMTFSSFASNGKGKLVFTWTDLSSHGYCDTFIASLSRISDIDIPHAITRFVFEHIENCYFRPDWWESLSKIDQNRLLARAEESGTAHLPRNPNCLCDDGVRVVKWNVQRRVLVNYTISS